MDENGRKVFEKFAVQLCEWADTGRTPAAGNQDIRYGLALQWERLEKYGARMEYHLKLRGEWLNNISDAVFSDTKYTNRLVWRSYQKTVSYFLNGKKCLSVKDNENMYTIITWLDHGDIQDTYCCPNCGNISDIKSLAEGCPYCKTRFLMSDLFPKITTYHFLRDYGLNNKEASHKYKKWMLTGALAGLLLVTPHAVSAFLQAGENGFSMAGSALQTLWSFVPAGVFGALGGYAAGAIGMLLKILMDAIRQVPMATGQLDAKKRLNQFMKKYDPGFSFEYFMGNIQALLKILIYTDDRSNLAVYDGPFDGRLFDNIIDAQYGGAISLNGCRLEGGDCYLDLNVYMTDTYCINNQVTRKNDVFQMVVCKSISRPVDYGFSIKKVSCRSCGASFDASKEKHCPYCGSSYELKEDGWVIAYLKKK